MLLEKCQGPECPRCGCQDSEEVDGRGRWGGLVLTRRVCKYCGYLWREKKWGQPEPSNGDNGESTEAQPPIPDAVIWSVIRCPDCKSRDTRVSSSPKPASPDMPRIRRHECKACGNTFKSVERE